MDKEEIKINENYENIEQKIAEYSKSQKVKLKINLENDIQNW